MAARLPTSFSRRQFTLALGSVPFAFEGFLKHAGLWASPKGQTAYVEMVNRVISAMAEQGAPLPNEMVRRIRQKLDEGTTEALADVHSILASIALFHTSIIEGGYALVRPGHRRGTLLEQGWSSFLVCVENEPGFRTPLTFGFDIPVLYDEMAYSSRHWTHVAQGDQNAESGLYLVDRAKAAISAFDEPPFDKVLTGLPIEYRIAQIVPFTADDLTVGIKADARPLALRDWAPARQADISFTTRPARNLRLRIDDVDGTPTMASLTITDAIGNVYPDRRGRLAPDMYFQEQVYRASGETLRLPDNRFKIVATRGPEYLPTTQVVEVGPDTGELHLRLTRWVDPARFGWYAGDVHIHGSGCQHYSKPTMGVAPQSMNRQVCGEGLWIADVLIWGPGFAAQSEHFTGRVAEVEDTLEHSELQRAHGTTLVPNTPAGQSAIMRYGLEISGFPSSHSGHPILLGLSNMRYPQTDGPADWPSWSLPILKWAKSQRGVTGFAHAGIGLGNLTGAIPSLDIPEFDNIGANEFLVDLAHDAVDFLSVGASSIPAGELSLWYHSLNCGFRTAILGETDWPCMSGERVGMARTYVGLNERPVGEDGYLAWLNAIRSGRCYMSDGRAHLLECSVAGAGLGAQVSIVETGTVRLEARIAALLPENPDSSVATKPLWATQFAHLERARLGASRKVLVEVVRNGQVEHSEQVLADGSEKLIVAEIAIEASSWVAIRILPSLHSNPVYILVGNRPIRASKSSAEWCMASIDKMRPSQFAKIRANEKGAAKEAYDFALETFARILKEADEG